MSKINILCVPPDRFGVGGFRFNEPHIEIQKQFGNDFHVEINLKPDWNNKQYMDRFQIISGTYFMMGIEDARTLIPQFQSEGKKVILDVDDYWELTQKNPQYEVAKRNNLAGIVLEYIKMVDYVTTTTEQLAKEIRKHSKNVLVFPNAIDPTAKKFQIKEELSERVRLGWLGGSTHLFDLHLLKPMFNSVGDKYSDKVQSVLCGFNLQGNVIDRDAHGNQFERPLRPEETPWYYYEKIFTSDYKNIDPKYMEYLMAYKTEEYENVDAQSYRRIWTKPFSSYTLNYNHFDISLIPLENDRFNSFKSELKIIEAGFFKKPIIASDVIPYQTDIKHGVNGFLVKEKSKKDWSYYVKNLIESSDMRKEFGESLYEAVKDKYDLRKVSATRAEWYKTIIK